MNTLNKLVGLSKEEFNQHLAEGNITIRPARLIPFDRAGDEMALTSVFLSSLRLVKEFRKTIFQDLDLPQSGETLYLTEITFKDYPECRLDGGIIIFKAGKITDAVLFEMKNGTNELQREQLDKYTELCKNLRIEKLATISNQFAADINSCPVGIKNLKSFSRYHLSWTYILTIAHILLFENDIAITDSDQIEIMREALEYLENKKSGVVGFNSMKKGWSDLVDQMMAGATLKLSTPEVEDTAHSWFQEEQDLALFLSRSLGVLVDTLSKRGKGADKEKIESLKRELIKEHQLSFNFRIKNVISDIKTTAYFDKRAIEFQVSLPVGSGGSRAKLSWLKKQLDYCLKKSPEAMENLKGEIYIDLLFKNSGKSERLNFNNLYLIKNEYNEREIREFKLSVNKDYGKVFSSPVKFIEKLEADSLEVYRLVIQHLEKWVEKAPEAKEGMMGYKGVERDEEPVIEEIHQEQNSLSIEPIKNIKDLILNPVAQEQLDNGGKEIINKLSGGDPE